MASGTTKAIHPWEWDVRVRERNLRKGMLDEKDVERHLAQLPDVGDQAEPVSIAQPALGKVRWKGSLRRNCQATIQIAISVRETRVLVVCAIPHTPAPSFLIMILPLCCLMFPSAYWIKMACLSPKPNLESVGLCAFHRVTT